MKLVEVFVEKDCHSCNEVISVLGRFSGNPSVELRVYERAKDVAAFRERDILVCPATFVNHRLVFYGAFTLSEIVRYLA